jgi:serine/threonine-protein kinase
MTKTPDKDKQGLVDEAEFEASLVSDIDGSLIDSDTQVVESRAVPAPQPPRPTAKQPPWVGKVLGRFKLLRLVGEGKMGRVIQAQDVNLHRIVALKVLCKRLPGIDEQRRVNQFLREARAAAQIEHPNVVHIYEINQHDGWWYIAMEMLEGGNLGQVVKAAGPLAVPKACAFVADAASALAVAHELGIIHRDIKPTNLMLARNGRCKVTDFGLVRLDDPNDPFQFTHKAVGSPLFMAPEVIRRQEQTPAIDVYSLGATLFYALTGKAPYLGQSLDEVLTQHVEAAVPDIRELLPDCPSSLAALVSRAMAKNPGERPSAGDMAAALRAESIATRIADSGTLTADTSSLLRELIGSGVLESTTPPPASTRAEGWERIRRLVSTRPFRISAAVAILVLVALLLFLLLPAGRKSTTPASLARHFPDAPESYGVLPPSFVMEPIRPGADEVSSFSWVGQIDPSGFGFVASRRGRHFYPVNAPAALLIRSEDLVGYDTAAEAAADGKVQAK